MAHYLIIAASSAIGQEVVRKLISQGDTVFTTARDASKIKPDALLDATDFDAVEAVFNQAGKIDGVVNCSGSLLLKSAHMTSKSEYQSVIDASLTTSFAVIHAAGKYMKEGGSVVLISSSAALTGLANHEAIAAAKAGIVGLTLSSAATYAHSGLRVNAIAPGMINTPLTSQLTSSPVMLKASVAMHSLGRIGETTDIANGVIFLLSPANNWITGQVLAIDGGLSATRPRAKV
jgi:NAD(P)-dependent dehydrogenase (short-subunit alcohol dehydrogenase family)